MKLSKMTLLGWIGLIALFSGLRFFSNHSLATGEPPAFSGQALEGKSFDPAHLRGRPAVIYFWATHGGAELDALLFKGGRRYGEEIKRADAPRMTPSMRHALEDLRLDGLTVVYPDGKPYPLAENVRVIPLAMVTKAIAGG